MCNKSTNIITTSENLAKFSSVLSKFKAKTIIVPLSINTTDYLNIETNDNDNFVLPNDYVLYLGRFSYYKGICVLLDAFEILETNIPLVIVGNGELVDEIKSRLKETKKNIILIDKFVTDYQKKLLLKNSKFLVFPSIFPSEAFGILQLEAMIYGKPVINTDLPTGVPWVSLHGTTGITVPVNCVKALSDAINSLYFDNKLITFYGENAKEKSFRFF
ncbi:glycosyltransferase [Vibrio sp. PP-XX7]